MSVRAWIAFLTLAVLWGIPFLFIKVAIDDGVPPAFVAWVRVVLAAALLVGLGWRLGLLRGLRGHWLPAAAYGVFGIALPFPLIAAGEQAVSSSLAAILIAATPLFVAVLALRFDHAERAQGRRLVGLWVGFAGVVALVGLDVAGNPEELLGAAAILLAALGYAIAPMVLKRRMSGVDPRASMAGALVVATVLLAPAALVAPPSSMPPVEAILALVGLGVLSTAAAFVLFGRLVTDTGPGRATVVTYLSPVVAVVLGVVVLGEEPGAGMVAGLLLIIAGSWLSTDGRLPPGLGAVVALARRRFARRPAEGAARPARVTPAP